MALDLSVVVVSFNTRDLLRDCLRSVFATLALPSPDGRQLNSEVWVVDNASADGSAAMVAEEFPSVRLIANEENRGFAAANNQALSRSTGRYVLLLNPDTVVLADALAILVAFMDAHPKAGAAGVALRYPNGAFQHSCFRFPTLLMSFFDFFPINHRIANSGLNGRYPQSCYEGPPFEVDHPLGACLIVRRVAAEQIGWLDEDFFIYCEEIDWCLRLRRAGWQIFCVPEAKAVHHAGQSTRQAASPMLLQLHRSRQLLFRKHYSPLYRWLARQIVRIGVANEAQRAAKLARAGRITLEEEEQRVKIYQAIWRL